ncbi:hypothetical protein [Dactylosporangium sp. CA-139066]|uniref:hypothetical protein n=1 Tax=Dactylosporangium sp. CA-139066 TaxID=3239930 RepID=UPI003D8A6CF2
MSIHAPTDTVAVAAPARTGRRKLKRRIAKGLAWSAVAFTGLLILAEPWLLIPVITFVVALSLWD